MSVSSYPAAIIPGPSGPSQSPLPLSYAMVHSPPKPAALVQDKVGADWLGVPTSIIGRTEIPTALTLGSYALGLWWCVGGPTWAGLVSIALDEVDGRVARAIGATSETGSALDWGTDVILTPLALRRLGGSFNVPNGALVAAPPILYAQAKMRADGKRPAVGSARAAIMVAAMVTEAFKGKPAL